MGRLLAMTVAGLAGCAGARVEPPTASISSELDEAAVSACNWLWAHQPEAKTWEYCGVLYRDEAGAEIRFGLPQRGSRPWQCRPLDPPPPAIPLGRYHNHRFGSEPSSTDRAIAKAETVLSHFLCGPSGIVRRFSAKEGTVNIR
jgi:hypothetical protein